MKKEIHTLAIIILLLVGCTSNSTLDWEGCELEEPDFVKERKDSLSSSINNSTEYRISII